MTNLNKKGFTLIELILGMTLFISVMVIATVGFVGINRTFSKGLARKQLSEAVQRSVEDLTRTVRNEGQELTFTPADEAAGTPNTLCGISVCYVWATAGSEAGGLYKVNIDQVDNFKDGQELLDDRYVVESLDTNEISGEKLVRIAGVFKSNQEDAFDSVEVDGKIQTVCKGTSQEGAITNCALERFDFAISTSFNQPKEEESP